MNIETKFLNVLKIKTYTKEEKNPSLDSFIINPVSLEFGVDRIALETGDEIPFILFNKRNNEFSALKIDLEDSLNEKLLKEISVIVKKEDPNNLYCYFGPSLSFANIPVSRNVIKKVMDLGYKAAVKKTNNVDYLDLQVLNVEMLRKVGIPFKNITISNFDTFEMEPYLYSKKRGDAKSNITTIELTK